MSDILNDPKVKQILEQNEKFDAPFTAGALGAARGATFGLSDQALVKSGLMSAEDLELYKNRNRIASTVGEVGGTLGSLAIPGGGLVGGVSKAGLAAEKLIAKTLIEDASKSVVNKLVKKSLEKVVGSSVEGAFYGAGQLLTEEALGNSEFNAESILSNVGLGAATGAAVGSIFGAFDLSKPYLNKAAKGAGQAVGKLLDKVPSKSDAVLATLGIDKAAKQKLSNEAIENLPTMLSEIPDAFKYRNTKDARTYFSKLSEDIADDSDKLVTFIDSEVLPANSIQALNKQDIMNKLATNLDEQIIKKYPEREGISEVKRVYNDLFTAKADPLFQTTNNLTLSLKDLLDLKTFYKNQVSGKFGNYSLKDKAFFTLRDSVDDILKTRLDELSEAVTDDMSRESILGLSKNLKNDRTIKDLLRYVKPEQEMSELKALQYVLRPIDSAKNAIMDNVANRVALMADVEKTAKRLSKNIQKSVNSFADMAFEGRSIKPRIGSISLLTDSALSGKAKSKEEAYENIKDKIEEFDSNPEMLVNNLVSKSVKSSLVLPQTYSHMAPKLNGIISYLKSQLPKDPKDLLAPHRVIKSDWKPSSMELNRFSRILRAAENPTSILEDLKSGTITREASDTVRILYPAIMSEIQSKLLDAIKQKKLSRSQKTQLTYILGSDIDGMYNGATIYDYQTIYSDNQAKGLESQSINKSYLDNPVKANELKSGVEQIATR